MILAHRISHLRPEGAYAVLARAQALEAQGREIVHLEIGQPDFETYPHIALAGIRAIATGQTRYNPPSGVPDLRQALADDAGRRRGVEFSPGAGRHRAGHQAAHPAADAGPAGAGRRGDLSRPRLSQLRGGHRPGRRGAGAGAPGRGDRLRPGPGGLRRGPQPPDAAGAAQLAQQSHRRRQPPETLAHVAAAGPRARPVGAVGRDLYPAGLRGRRRPASSPCPAWPSARSSPTAFPRPMP